LQRLGKVLHLSNSRKLVLRTKVKVEAGTEVLSANWKSVGTVFDIFGPVGKPYVSIKTLISNPDHYIGRFLYTVVPQGH